MFCHKCGAKIPDESTFCFKCGAKTISENVQEPSDAEGKAVQLKKPAISEPTQTDPVKAESSLSPQTEQLNDDAEFRNFIDKRVQEMTKCSSASKLLKKHPMRIPLIIFYGFFFLIGIMVGQGTNNIGLFLTIVLFTTFFAFGFSCLAGWAISLSYVIKHRNEVNGEICDLDTDDLIYFLNSKLSYLKPDLGDWGYMDREYGEAKNKIANIFYHHLQKKEQRTKYISSQCGKWYSPFSIVSLKRSETTPEATVYGISSGTSYKAFFCISTYVCLYKTAPIISAAMEYYRQHQQEIKEEHKNIIIPKNNDIKLDPRYRFVSKHFELIVILIAAILIIMIVASENSKEFIKIVSDSVPVSYEENGLHYSFGTVFNRYIDDQKWEKDSSGINYTVYLNGKFKSSEKPVKMTFDVSGKEEYVEIVLTEIEFDGVKLTSDEEISLFLSYMFSAYDANVTAEEFCSQIFDTDNAMEADTTAVEFSEETDIIESEDDIIRNAYSEKIQELAAENNDMTFSLIDLTADDVYELVADKSGYYVNIYSYDNGSVVPIVEERGYGTGGNYGYSYLPGRNILSNEDMDGAGSLLYTSYYCVDSGHRLLQLYNNNSLLYEYPSGYFLGDSEISESEYKDYMIYGDYSYITGTFTADQILTQLSEKTEIRDHFEDTIIFNNTPISSFIGTPIDSITCQWGEPAEYDYGSCRYDGIYFGYNYTGKIVYVTIDPKMCSINGTTLDKCRDDLAILLGTPQYEGMEADYCMCYYDFTDNGSLYIDMESPDDTPYQIRLDASYYQQ